MTTPSIPAAYRPALAAVTPLLPLRALAHWERAVTACHTLSPQATAELCARTPEAIAVYGASGMLEWANGALRLARRFQDGGHVALAALGLGANIPRSVRTGLMRIALRHAPESHLESAALLTSLLRNLGRLRPPLQRHLLRIMQGTVAHHPQVLETVTWCCAEFFPKLAPAELGALFERMDPLVAARPGVAMNLLHEAVLWRRLPDPERKAAMLHLTIDLAHASPRAAFALARAAENVAERLTDDALPQWYRGGHDLLPALEEEAVNYFSLLSRTSLENVRALSPSIALEEVREVLRMYAQGLTGRSVNLITTAGLALRQGTWTPEDSGETPMPTVFAAPLVDRLPTKEANFSVYKVNVAHQTGHFTFGTYGFGFETPGAVFPTVRTEVETGGANPTLFPTQLDRYFTLFRHQRLGRDVFAIAEDARIDARMWGEYRGIRSAYGTVQRHTLERRPDAALLPLREFVVEQLIRHSLDPECPLQAPRAFVERVRQALGIVDLLAGRGRQGDAATVEDAAEAALRLYILIRAVPNLPTDIIPRSEWVEIDPTTAHYDPAADVVNDLIAEFHRVNKAEGEGIVPPEMMTWDEPESPYHSPQSVDHHAEPQPEQMQNLMEMQARVEQNAFEDIQRIIQQVADEMREREEADGRPKTPQVLLDDDEKPESTLFSVDPDQAIPDTRAMRNRSPSVFDSITDDAGTISFYDEWDYRIGGYRQRWCRVLEQKLAEGKGEFYQKTVQEHPGLVLQVRRQFEMLRPQGMAPVKRLLDGEDFDLDALVESVIDRRSGNGRADKIYWRRRSTERSVVVSVLLDMSFSTGERVDEDIRYYSARYIQEASPGMPPELSHNTATKRIIELEKEALVLLIEALDRLGDPYGIYGFSSAGRGEVRFYTLKEPDEMASPQVKARIDSIVPLQGTRIGPAVRHATAKLAAAQAQTKLLLLLTDGRPQDKDYGVYGYDATGSTMQRHSDGENEYAVHDTKAAFREARARGITPFVVSIDKEGHDYLKQMCGDMGYEMVSNLEALPHRLPALYRRLTT
ncbi:MAG: VWA domain-containing protein [Dehalococcoidia bacterium]|nr:VWA domain-containing protein [Dehalococcoidia bacterium]